MKNFIGKISILLTFCAFCLFAQNTFAQDYKIQNGETIILSDLYSSDTITTQSTGGPVCSLNVGSIDNNLITCLYYYTNNSCVNDTSPVTVQITSNAGDNSCLYSFIGPDNPPELATNGTDFSSLGTGSITHMNRGIGNLVKSIDVQLSCPDLDGQVELNTMAGLGLKGDYGLSCVNAPAPLYYCEATTKCPGGMADGLDKLSIPTDQNACCQSGEKFNPATGNCDKICTPVNAVMSAWSACVAPVDTTKGNQTRTVTTAANSCGIAAGPLSQSCTAPLVCSTGNVPNATKDACVPCPLDTNYSPANGGTCLPQCTGLVENQVCFKTSEAVAGGLSELFQLNKNAEGYTSPNVHSCFKAGVVDFTPVATTDLDYGRKFNISCGKIANAITSGATTAVDNGSVRDINAVVR